MKRGCPPCLHLPRTWKYKIRKRIIIVCIQIKVSTILYTSTPPLLSRKNHPKIRHRFPYPRQTTIYIITDEIFDFSSEDRRRSSLRWATNSRWSDATGKCSWRYCSSSTSWSVSRRAHKEDFTFSIYSTATPPDTQCWSPYFSKPSPCRGFMVRAYVYTSP